MTKPSSAPSVQSAVARLYDDGAAETLNDDVAVEEPLEIRIGNRPFVVTMRTPGHDKELAVGFLVSEGIAHARSDILEVDRCRLSPTPENTIRVRFSERVNQDDLQSDRHGAVSSSCGVCGKTSLESICREHPAVDSNCRINRTRLFELPSKLRENQVVFDRTGGLHSSGVFDLDGNLVCLREDVGRHNALDKAIGFAMLNDIWPLNRHVLVVSGRVSFEIIQKALAARISIVAAVSAPTSLAISAARECGITLVGFLRSPKMNVYAHPHRIRD